MNHSANISGYQRLNGPFPPLRPLLFKNPQSLYSLCSLCRKSAKSAVSNQNQTEIKPIQAKKFASIRAIRVKAWVSKKN